ncbi:MAG: hypothetical protein VB021_06740 [Oscillospiraceae bacterium]|nr:hypothetical protein [Oscillospiraceae bacterium]
MKDKYALLAGGAALLVFIGRLADVLLHVESGSGFYAGGSAVRFAAPALALAASALLRARWAAAFPGDGEKQPAAGALFAAAGLFAVSLSAMQLLAEVALASSAAVGAVSALCAAAGFAAAWWFYTAAVRGFTGRREGGALLPAAVVLWYCLRALAVFVRGPINANDSVTISVLLSCLALAGAYLAFVREKPQFPAAAALALAACVGFALPSAVWYLREDDAFRAAQLIGDAFGALGLFAAAERAARLKKEEEK